ncbi:Vta1 like-domain-containing protein [Zychaea mexicana]|uniref:Vta1 like-domain-containing protein n=1 Tax=Zychaea mexicana TaxID=64656 RepID=UPI0022FF42FB|nr:Vta1 like-domain-containing protein [Zychaea mexicana]KAI9492028.1 Vta1 like-domain-containing protein [Zychaea mexicana]
MEIPADIKYIAPYIQRGQELSERDPIVSYYAQYYAVKMAISKGPSNKETNAYLSQLLDKLEQVKTALGANNEAITSDLVGYAHLENFALKVFLNADNEDRSGKASKKTAKTFLAASIFLELLKTFDDLDPEIEAKIKYAKWKAADIMKALREGRTPTPGAPGEQQQEDEEMAPPSNFTAPLPGNASAELPPNFTPPPPASATPSSPGQPSSSTTMSQHPSPPPAATSPPVTPSNSTLPHVPPPTTSTPPPPVVQQKQQPPPPQPVAAPAPVQTSTSAGTSDTPMLDPGSVAAAQKHAKWAISALNYDDIKTARTQLLTALNDLGYNQQNNFGY